MITSAENRPWPGDVTFGAAFEEAGLPAPSVVRAAKIATIEAGHAEKIGAAPRGILTDVDRMVRANLGFSN